MHDLLVCVCVCAPLMSTSAALNFAALNGAGNEWGCYILP